jgi:hypothetical protein
MRFEATISLVVALGRSLTAAAEEDFLNENLFEPDGLRLDSIALVPDLTSPSDFNSDSNSTLIAWSDLDSTDDEQLFFPILETSNGDIFPPPDSTAERFESGDDDNDYCQSLGELQGRDENSVCSDRNRNELRVPKLPSWDDLKRIFLPGSSLSSDENRQQAPLPEPDPFPGNDQNNDNNCPSIAPYNLCCNCVPVFQLRLCLDCVLGELRLVSFSLSPPSDYSAHSHPLSAYPS